LPDTVTELIFIGKPGFGKTVLSTHVIEHLQTQARELTTSDASGDTCHVVYFHFDQGEPSMVSYIAALQSIAGQLLFSRPFDNAFIDAASFSMSRPENYQVNASENDLRELILVYIKQLKHTFLVIDGLDECSTWNELIPFLQECTTLGSCCVIAFTRPHLQLDSSFGNCILHLNLQGQENLEDMKLFIGPHIQDLVSAGKIAGHLPVEEIVTSLALQADSIFLWSVLISAYLNQAGLTPNERLDIITGKVSFQGLDNLFDRILYDIAKRTPKWHLKKVTKIFQWLVVGQELWTKDRLHVALSVQENRSSNKDDFIPDFGRSLMLMCGPLIELRTDETVRFIHLSVAEYLSKPTATTPRSDVSALRVQVNAAHCSLARLGLVYLLHEVSHEALGGSPSVTADATLVSQTYSLLQYVSRYWAFHATMAFEILGDLEEAMFKQECFSSLVSMLSNVVNNKLLLTLWIEACWTFQIIPDISDLALNIASYVELRPPKSRPHLQSLSDKLAGFSSSLQILNKTWHRVLKTEPNEMWQQSIPAFTKSEFWIGTNEVIITSLHSEKQGNRSIMIASQVSSNGKEVGVVKLWPPV
jgi:hypothetical protein